MAQITQSSWKLRKSVAHPGAGNTITYEIDKGGFLEDLLIVARGTVNVTGGTTNGTATADYNPQNLLRMLEVDSVSAGVYPDGTLKRVYPDSVYARHIFDEGVALNDNLGATIAATGSTAICCPWLLRFALPLLQEPNETSLFTQGYTGLQLILYCGSGTDLFSGNDRTWDFSQVVFDIYDRRNQGSPNATEVAVLYESDIVIPINGANQYWNLRDYLSQTQSYLDILAMFQTTSAHTLSDALLNQIRTIEDSNGVAFEQNIRPEALKFRQTSLVKHNSLSQVGMYHIDLAEDFQLSELIYCPAITIDVNNPGGANQDRIILSTRRILMPSVNSKTGAVSFS